MDPKKEYEMHIGICPYQQIRPALQALLKRINFLETELVNVQNNEKIQNVTKIQYMETTNTTSKKEALPKKEFISKSIPYTATVSSKNQNYSNFSYEGLISGTQQFLTTSMKTDYIRISLTQSTLISGFTVGAPSVGGVDASRLNNAFFQRAINDNLDHWETVLIIEGVKNNSQKDFFFRNPIYGRYFQFAHGNISSGSCLGLGKLCFFLKD